MVTLEKRKNLGRGLSALLPQQPIAPTAPSQVEGERLAALNIDEVLPCDAQPRKFFAEDGIEELSESIQLHGILQPIVVRRRAANQYEIVAGERRWRAAKRAGLKTIKAVISDVAEQDTLTLALVENIQRRDLNAMEEAEAYQRLTKELGYTQSEVAHAVGKDRATIANSLRLLKLPNGVQQLVVDGSLSMGHARALLSLNGKKTMEKFAIDASDKGWSVRDTERAVKDALNPTSGASKSSKSTTAAGPKPESQAEKDVRLRIQRALATKVEMKHRPGGKGTFQVHFGSYEELEAIMARIGA